ncbi:MAG: hypothetical protein IPL21_19560 [Saprospirales bacterium]|nr:hypothetical protein [Saprospirales bacterium]
MVVAERSIQKNLKEDGKISLTVLSNTGDKIWQRFLNISNKLDGQINIIQEQITP